MKTYLLVHGAWRGGWCWRATADWLRQQGHRVFTPSLTGLGDRRHLLSPHNNLSLHIQDIVQVLQVEDLSEVVLVGHSYAGMVVTGVTDQLRQRVGCLVYVDAYVPQDGQSMLTVRPAHYNQQLLATVQDGLMPPLLFPLARQEDRLWMEAHLGPMSFACYTQPIQLSQPPADRRIYIRSDFPNEVFDASYQHALNSPGWQAHRLPCGHDIMVDCPLELAQLLDQV